MDGSLHMVGPQWWDDMDHQNEVGLDDRLLLRFPSHAIREDPERVAAQIERGLRRTRQGYPPQLTETLRGQDTTKVP